MNVVCFNLTKLFNIVSAIALALLLVTTLSNQSHSQNKQAKSWNIEVSACQAPDAQTQDDEPWANHSTTYQLTLGPQNRDASVERSPQLATHSYSLRIRAPPQAS